MPCIRNALLKGYIPTPVLAPRIVGAAAAWVDWHHDFALNQLPAAIAEDEHILEAAAGMDASAEIYVIDERETALQVWGFCRSRTENDCSITYLCCCCCPSGVLVNMRCLPACCEGNECKVVSAYRALHALGLDCIGTRI